MAAALRKFFVNTFSIELKISASPRSKSGNFVTKIIMQEILKDLNEAQKEAVQYTKGPLLIVAGAGSGKTRVIAHRIAYLIFQGVNPESILAVTFTNKAAREMQERIFRLLKWKMENGNWKLEKKKTIFPTSNLQSPTSNFQLPFISTFHSLGVYILRQDGKKIGVPKNFSILDEDDSLKIIKDCLKELDLNQESFQPSRIRSFISQQKNKLIDSRKFNEEANNYFPKIAAEVWSLYEEKLKNQSALDFDDLIMKTIVLLRLEPDILKKYQDKWQFVHIDEYQDTNYGQYILSRLLTGENGNICVVGDADQAIYSFRGADFTNILRFEKDWKNAKIITLETNYRSTQNILDAANAAISFNKTRVAKNLWSAAGEKGSQPSFSAAENEIEEGEFVADKIEDLFETRSSQKIAFPARDSVAVLLRTNFQSRIFEEIFLKRGIPYEMFGVKFYERKEIKDILAYLKYSLNQNDFLSFGRIVNAPPCGIGEKTLLKYFKKDKNIQAEKRKRLDRIEKLIEHISKLIQILSPSSLIKQIFKESGFQDYLENLGEEGLRKTENIKEMVSLAKKYDSFPSPFGTEKLLEDSVLMSEQDALKEDIKGVKIMTVHAAKGLEFDNVFTAGLEEGLFPYFGWNDLDKEIKLEEERRLFYVALTRARKNAFLSYAKTRTIFGEKKINKPSRFLGEIESWLAVDNSL